MEQPRNRDCDSRNHVGSIDRTTKGSSRTGEHIFPDPLSNQQCNSSAVRSVALL